MSIKIRIETSNLNSPYLSGVGYYTSRLIDALAHENNTQIYSSSFNFLGRKPSAKLDKSITREINTAFPLKVYAKLQTHKLAPAFDLGKQKVDLTIFPNFAHWPNISSSLTATVIHDLAFIHHPDLLEKKNLPHLQRVVKRSIVGSDFIITTSLTMKGELQDEYNLEDDKIVLTPIPPDEKFFRKNTNEIHKKYNIPTKKYLLFIGTIEPRKNIPLLIKAFTNLSKNILNNYSLVICGGMGWKSEASILAISNAKEKGLPVVYAGYIDEDDKPSLYQQASIFIMPSIYEGFGMPILEAAASKTPIIASDIPVFREVAKGGAYFFSLNDPSSLTEAITRVINDKAIQLKLVDNAHKQLDLYSWHKSAQNIIKAANKLLR